MQKPLLLFLLASLPLPALAQLGNVIHHVEPNRGPVSGGTAVVITGDFSLEPPISPPCFGADVYVGGRKAEVISFTTERVEVQTRPYTPGRFDVVVDRCGHAAVLQNGFVYGDLVTERALLPVVLESDVPGAFGAVWRTEAVGMLNVSGLQHITSQPHLPCALPEGCFFSAGWFVPTFPRDLAGPGRLLYAQGFEFHPVHLALRVRNVSREQESLGTELPVVWEDESYGPRTLFSIPDIPRGANYRSKLRLYRIDTADPADVIVRLTAEENPVAIERTLTLSGGLQEEISLLQPPYAELDLDPLFGLAGGRRAVVVLTPDEGLYWGFVSVTNNLTQQITTVTP